MCIQSIARIQRMSKRFRRIFVASFFFIPVIDLLYWLFFNRLPDGFLAGLPVAANQDLPPLFLALGFLASLVPLGVALFGLLTLIKLFRLYEEAIVFTCENVQLCRRLGYTIIAWVFANMLFILLISIVITVGDPAGEPMIVVGFDTSDLAALIMGAIVVLISWVMNEGRKLEDEQEFTI